MSDTPIGQLFSQTYLTRPSDLRDSVRFRRRLAAAIGKLPIEGDLGEVITAELGIEVPFGGYSWDWPTFYERAELRDVLDSVTYAWRLLRGSGQADTFRNFVRRALLEEGLGYRLDDQGGVHLNVDIAFETGRIAALSALARPEHSATREAFERGYTALDSDPPDTLTGVRAVFEAVENRFKQMFAVPRIGSSEVTRYLQPLVRDRHVGPAQAAAGRMAESLGQWVNACHSYRHAAGEPEPAPPPMNVAVALISSGAAHLRWLLSFEG